ncbi:hypothetical protein [Candidatus Finniella inopinata]|uniref:Uncharacterized protein n=1 Tax=Candidatus Finniella inopinata TaxID=1696036 RepID=A0A4Q7DFJ8_9PROT|nr:hypothetical protein [Candidatus Finniella inopinata]RZI45402.1 hypothetical protein EQU50_07195 [Candidatus Finniella inopinata]
MQVFLIIVTLLSVLFAGEMKASESAESLESQVANTTPSESIPFKDQPYERFVSLGDRCHVAHNINYYLAAKSDNPIVSSASQQNIAEGKIANALIEDLGKRKPYFWGGFPFDWVRIEDYAGLIRLIERDFSQFFDKGNIVGYWEEPNLATKQTLYDKLNCITRRNFLESIVLKRNDQQDFSYRGFAEEYNRTQVTDFLEAPWKEEYERCHQKIGYMIDKFRNLKSYKTLYIINYQLPDHQLKELSKALAKSRMNLNFTIIVCHHEVENRKIDDNIVLRKTACLHWVNNWYWDTSILDEFKLDPKILEGLRESYKSDKTQ